MIHKVYLAIFGTVLMLPSMSLYAESISIVPGLWSIEMIKADNSNDNKKQSCITKESLEKSSRPFHSSCILTLLTSTKTDAEWEVVCPNGKKTRWQMHALSPKLIENSSVRFDEMNKAEDDRFTVKSQAKWISANCGDVKAVFPATK